MIVLCSNTQIECINEHTNNKCYVLGEYSQTYWCQMSSFMYAFNELVDHFVT